MNRLHQACRQGDLRFLKQVLEVGEDDVLERDNVSKRQLRRVVISPEDDWS
jgi:hypothetical protein